MYSLGAIEPDKEIFASASVFLARSNYNVPETLDLRSELMPIRDQKGQGACVAFSAACIVEYFARRSVMARAWFSPQFIYNNRKNSSEGMQLSDAVNILKRLGTAQERLYKYGPPNIHSASEIPDEVYEDAKNWKVLEGHYIRTIDETKNALFHNGPCMISFATYNYTNRFWKKQSPNETVLGGHCVTIVGYNKEGFILRNSWGEKWGDKGYTIFPYDDFGIQWEIWTIVDTGIHPNVPDYPKKSCLFPSCC